MPNQITLLHVDVPMAEPFRISSGMVSSKEAILVLIERNGVTGIGEASPMSGDFYSSETPGSSWEFLEQYALPEMIRDKRMRPAFVSDHFARHPGRTFGWAGIEGAIWDLMVQEEKAGFTELLELEPRPIESGLTLGIQPSIEELLDSCRRLHLHGQRRVKIKIEPGWDLEPLRAVRGVLDEEVALMADANASYGDEHLEVFDDLDKLGLLMIEQPLAADNFDGHRKLQKRIQTPICFDESAVELQRLESAIMVDACRIVNVKIQRVGGIMAARRMIERCAALEIPTWMGTMPELGIGALHALYLGLHPNNEFPSDVCQSERWYVEDLIDPPLTVTEGMIGIPEPHRRRPQVNMDAVDRFARRAKSIPF